MKSNKIGDKLQAPIPAARQKPQATKMAFDFWRIKYIFATMNSNPPVVRKHIATHSSAGISAAPGSLSTRQKNMYEGIAASIKIHPSKTSKTIKMVFDWSVNRLFAILE